MIVREAANQVLRLLDFEDEEEYNLNDAVFHVGQAIHEINEGNEFPYANTLTQTSVSSPASGQEPSYWTEIPGRVPLTQILSTTWGEFGYIKHGWISSSGDTATDGNQAKFPEGDLRELLDTYGDDEGTPQKFAIEGDYMYYRPIPAAGESHIVRFLWHKAPELPGEDDEPRILQQIPFGVIYYASMLACIWSQDDARTKEFGRMAQRSFDMYEKRVGMRKGGPGSMEDFNG